MLDIYLFLLLKSQYIMLDRASGVTKIIEEVTSKSTSENNVKDESTPVLHTYFFDMKHLNSRCWHEKVHFWSFHDEPQFWPAISCTYNIDNKMHHHRKEYLLCWFQYIHVVQIFIGHGAWQYSTRCSLIREDRTADVFNTNKYININMSSADVYQSWNYRDRFIVMIKKGAPVWSLEHIHNSRLKLVLHSQCFH
jgi:hypothetical protein